MFYTADHFAGLTPALVVFGDRSFFFFNPTTSAEKAFAYNLMLLSPTLVEVEAIKVLVVCRLLFCGKVIFLLLGTGLKAFKFVSIFMNSRVWVLYENKFL